MASTYLRDLIADRVNGRWEQWAAAHPNLAAAIDRTRLVDSTIEHLRSDPEFVAAMRQADLDENKLAAAARVLEQLERWVGRVLPL
ncbi:MAG: hypothetical protein V3U29_06390 [Phycisphaeraceae bacterium]